MQVAGVKVDLAGRITDPPFVCDSGVMQDVRNLALRIASGSAKVLITGESGVGKDLIARLIHVRSSRANRPFVPVNCGAVSEALLESELFGHARGSFTGAHRDKVGKLELANHGTIFLDEVAEMSLRMQVTLLRFLENGEIQRVGADSVSAAVDVRVIAATNQDLPALVASGRFREDLLYRLKVAHIHVPPLRERSGEIRALVGLCVERCGVKVEFSEEALRALERYRWPGNVRELQNVVESLVWTSGAALIGREHLPAYLLTGDARVAPARERRRQRADDLFAGLVGGTLSFWDHVHPLFLDRDLTRQDLRDLVRRGLSATGGSYRALLKLFGLSQHDYKKFLNFLATHQCTIDYRAYRRGQVDVTVPTPQAIGIGATPAPGVPGRSPGV